ncbi:hypothetical protein N9W79_02355 [bacterium]|nr:hypothetical protein [bacterium]
MNRFLAIPILIAACLGCTTHNTIYTLHSSKPQETRSYCGCLLFVDHANNVERLNGFEKLPINGLTRSWYHWGELAEDKKYETRKQFLSLMQEKGIYVGGGGTLSVLNQKDLDSKSFNKEWLSLNIDGSPYQKRNRFYGSLSHPGFRNYLIKTFVEQVSLGVKQLSLGETNGQILFDDYTLGIKGDSGFIQWLSGKYRQNDSKWWKVNFGRIGEKIAKKQAINRTDFVVFAEKYKPRFEQEFGKVGSWRGTNREGNPAFLYDQYKKNLDAFLSELRLSLVEANLNAEIDIWGFADWMFELTHKPDAFLATPPGHRWGLKWATDTSGPFSKYEERMKEIMLQDIERAYPAPVIYLIDHPSPFQEHFINLKDERQAYITKSMANLIWSLDANFVFRSYSLHSDRENFGPKLKEAISKGCRQVHSQNFCPARH